MGEGVKCRIIILLFFLILVGNDLNASHLMGGSLGYEYIGLQVNGKYRYRIHLTTYIDCGPSSEIPYAEYPIEVGIYANDLMNPNADKLVVDSVLLFVDDTTVYTPFLPPGCNVGANTCIIQARYSGFIDLPASIHGYYLFYERCCRNNAILNLQPNASEAFIAYIPPTNVVNSSPVFLYPPIPFLCVNDTTTILNIASDIDGDSLIYEFTIPPNGFANSSNPNPNIPAPTLTWPVLPVDYVPGFTYTEPFNYFGSAIINNQNGVANYFSMQQGTFVVCIVVKEYRNGVLISQTLRDLQLLFNNCPNNYAPNLVDNLQRNYTVSQGDTLCFPISFLDPENDSVFIDANGDIFDPLMVDTPAAFFITDIDSNKATGNFCWTVPCTMDTGVHHFFMHAIDNGCPPKERFEFYTIHIIPPKEPYLLGADTACKGTDSVLYWMMVDNGYQYNWNVANGTITQNYGDSVVIEWGSLDSGWVYVDVFTATGCYINSDSLEISLIDVPSLMAMPEDTVCQFDTLLLTATGLVPYYWYPESSMVNPQEGDCEAIIANSGWFYVAGLPGERCPPSDSVYITALGLPNITATVNDSLICIGDTIDLNGAGAIEYHWFPDAIVFDPYSANTAAVPEYSGFIILTGIDSNQCRNYDTVFVSVNPGPDVFITGDLQICFGDSAFLTASGGVLYNWSPNTYISPDTGATVMVLLQSDAQIFLEVVDSNGCKMDTTLNVVVNELPNPSFNYDTLDIGCEGTWLKFTNTTVDAEQYSWILGNGAQSSNVDPQSLYPFGGSYVVQLTAINSFGCQATVIDTVHTDSLLHLVEFNHVNVFTPDGNGINDVLDFSLPVDFLECSNVYIHDRWGLLMFSSDGNNFSWDGKMDGKKVPEGVYFWIVDINGVKAQGFVHVFD